MPLIVVGWLSLLVCLPFGLPGGVVLLACSLAASRVARRGELSGRDGFGNPCAAGKWEQHREDAWRRRDRHYRMLGDYDPRRPAFALACGLAGIPFLIPSCWPWPLVAVGWVANLIIILDWFGCASRSVGWLRVSCRRVEWAKSRLPATLALAGGGILAGALLWAFTALTIPALVLPCVLAPLPLYRSWRAARRQYRLDCENAMMVMDWLDSWAKPTVGARPTGLEQSETGRHGERCFLLQVARPSEWTERSVRDAWRVHANPKHVDPAVTLNGDDRNRVRCYLLPDQAPDVKDMLADPTGLEAWVAWESVRLGFNYATRPGRMHLTQVASLDGRPAVYAWDWLGAQPDWEEVRRDWLRGSTDGELGDWGTRCGLTMTVDPGFAHAFVRAAGPLPDQVQADGKARRWMTREFSTTSDLNAYLRLCERVKADEMVWDNLLAGSKLPVPVRFAYDNETTIRSSGIVLRSLPLGVSSRGGFQAADYMRLDCRPAMGDATLADILPMPNPRGGWFTRWMRLVTCEPAVCPSLPVMLRDMRGDDPVTRLLAQIACSRACSRLLKTPPMVGAARQLAARGFTLWRIPISLTGGVTAADMRRVQPRLQAMMGADVAYWRWEDAGRVTLYAGDGCPTDPTCWLTARERDLVLKLRLDAAWSSVKGLTTREGRGVSTVSIEPASGSFTRFVFDVPAGLDPAMVADSVDVFCAAAGFAYARREPSDKPGRLVFLLSERFPLPDRADVDWGLLDAKRDRVAFALMDDGSPAYWDPADTPHLLASGTTGSGKSSVSMTIMAGALRLGWQCMMADPSKGGNDFRPIRGKLACFADTLPDCYAMVMWAKAEMDRRVKLIAEHGGGDLNSLPAAIRPKPLLVMLDEFNSLLVKDKAVLANPFNDPDIDNENTMRAWENGLRQGIGLAVGKLLTQGRSAQVCVLLGAQQLNAKDLDLMPAAGTAKNMLGRVFLGNGNTAGNVSQSNVRDANRMLRQAMAAGGMPKGRGLYERMGRGVVMIQCFWSGKDEAYARQVSMVPDATPLDLSGFRPAKPRLVGVAEPAVEPTVKEVSLGGMDWTVD